MAVFQKVVFKVLAMIMWVAPVGAFGAIAAVVGETGVDALRSLALLMVAFYLTCAIFVVGVLGGLLKVVTGLSIFSVLRYLAREFLLIVSTSSSETALPRLIAKMEHLGVSRPVVGHHRADRLQLQPRRHRDLPDDGLAVHRRGHRHPAGASASRSACWCS